MSKAKFIGSFAVVVGMGVVLFFQHRALVQLRHDNDELRTQVERLTQEQSAGQSASDISSNKEVEEQIAELLRLRGEVTQLRKQTNEISVLRRQNESLQEFLKKASAKAVSAAQPLAARVKKSPEDALPQDIHPKNTWSFRGYDSPDAAVESMIWAMKNGDKSAFMAGLSPELQARIDKDINGKNFAEEMRSHDVEEFRILDRQAVSDDEMVVTVYTSANDNGTSKGHSEDTHFKRVNGQWQVFEK
jgi:hypothetical protein